MAALGFDELVIDFASYAVKAIEILQTMGQVVDAVVTIEMHVLWTFDTDELIELFAALGCQEYLQCKYGDDYWVQKHTRFIINGRLLRFPIILTQSIPITTNIHLTILNSSKNHFLLNLYLPNYTLLLLTYVITIKTLVRFLLASCDR